MWLSTGIFSGISPDDQWRYKKLTGGKDGLLGVTIFSRKNKIPCFCEKMVYCNIINMASPLIGEAVFF
ncbi:MAG: hypothetical protein SWH68_08755 [Thermodesulfobacteriota bacterium]|nr:hypothetical protein [Thermodesulfobacteriota bacterium]